MARNPLRYILVGLTATAAGLAWGDTIYMFSRQDGSHFFSRAPSVPRFAAYSNIQRSDRNRHRRIATGSPLYVKGLLSGKSHYEPLVEEVARNYQLDAALLHAVISVESRYNYRALSPAGAAGLMQLMPATARRYGVENVLDPEQNLRGGARYLRDLLGMFGSDIRLAVAAYHAGEYAVIKNKNTIPPFQSTIEYVAKVLEMYERYRDGTGT